MEQRQEENKNRLEYMGSDMGTTTKADREDQAKKRRVEQIKRYTKNLAERFGILNARENQIKDRIQTRIAKFEENGFDMSEAKQGLLEIESNLESVQNRVEVMTSNIVSIIENPQTTEEFRSEVENLFESVKAETHLLKEEFKNIHRELVQVVEKVKEKLREQQPPTPDDEIEEEAED